MNFIFFGILFLNAALYSQTLETRLQWMVDSVYEANPESVGILVHVESAESGISWSGASGYPDKQKKKSLKSDQPALIASNTKTYVSASILRLVEEEKLMIGQPVKTLLTEKTRRLFEGGGYDLDAITLAHLLSHTSGVQDYANQVYNDFISNNKSHRWTRDAQLELTIETGPPLGPPGTVFNYADANFLLLTEIIEGVVGEPFYTAMRQLLRYEALGIDNTWFPTLEKKPKGSRPLVHQYWSELNWDSQEIDVSTDLYGGGGIAATTEDLAVFFYKLFNAEIIEDTTVLNLIHTHIETTEEKQNDYFLGLSGYEYKGLKGYGHGGFWGTVAIYFPTINTSVSVFVLERDTDRIQRDVLEEIAGILSDHSGAAASPTK